MVQWNLIIIVCFHFKLVHMYTKLHYKVGMQSRRLLTFFVSQPSQFLGSTLYPVSKGDTPRLPKTPQSRPT